MQKSWGLIVTLMWGMGLNTPISFAWDKHQAIMEQLLEIDAAKLRLYPYQKVKVPCIDDEKKEIESLAKELEIRADKVPIFSTTPCNPHQDVEIIMSEMLTGKFVDEPDMGMDQDLPEAADPRGFRKHMGGSQGPTSQGFRHMYFPGIEWGHPVDTFQIPFGPVGDVFDRIMKLRAVTERYLQTGNKFFGIRTLMWELHYVQDMFQPFHSTQIPSWNLIPLRKIFTIVSAATQSIGNFHYAYEGLVHEWVRDYRISDFHPCFDTDAIKIFNDPKEIMVFSRTKAKTVGDSLATFMGPHLKGEIDLPNGVGEPDYYALVHAAQPEAEEGAKAAGSSEAEAYKELKKTTCEIMKVLAQYCWGEIDRVFVK